jgi:Ca2+-binding EF-hand superfamily protein
VSFALKDHSKSIRTGWVENGDVAFLALDKDGDGDISTGLELFGEGTELSPGKLAKDGFAALKVYDLNQDSRIDASDEVYRHLKLWWDYNNSGRVEAGELESLAESGIRYLSLNAVKVEGEARWNQGNLVDTMSESDVKLYDVFFLTQPQ